jgi:alanyl aminopeptidase
MSVFAASCQPANGHKVTPPKSAASDVPLGRLPRVVVPQRYRLALDIDPRKERFSGHVEIDVTISERVRSFYLHGLGLAMHSAEARLASGKTIALTYRQVDESGVALLTTAEPMAKGPATLLFDYDAPFGHSLFGLYKVMDGGILYAFSQFEPIRARRVFPSFDEPGFKTPFDITVTAPKEDKVVTNTPVTNESDAGNGALRHSFATTLPLPTYLIAFIVGPIDIVDGGDIAPNAIRNRPLPLRGIATKGKGAQLRLALQAAHKIVATLEDYFALPYPFQKLDIIAVPDFSSNAMENSGAITFRQQLILLDSSSPLDQRRFGLSVEAHEITHQWFGDLVTPVWWEDLWLNESFARWMQSKVAAVVAPDEDFDRATLGSNLHVMDIDELPSARRIRQPVNGPNDIENAFDRITYDKGGAVLQMFENYVGPDVFRDGIRAYLRKHAQGNASASDFISEVAAAAHKPEIAAQFDSFLNQPGIPSVAIAVDCSGPTASFRATPSMYAQLGRMVPDRQWQIPMCYEAGGQTTCADLDGPTTTSVAGSQCPVSIMPNARGTGYYRFSFSEHGWDDLIGEAPRMSAADQLTLFHNLNAAFRAGHATAAQLFRAIKLLAPVAQWDLLGDMKDVLRGWRSKILVPEDLPAYRAFIRMQFGERLEAMGLSPKSQETPSTALNRIALLQLMIEEGRDARATRSLAEEAQHYLSNGVLARSGLSSDLLQEAMRAGVQHQGPAFSDGLLEALVSSNDEYFRRSTITALTGSDDPAILDKLLALALTPKIRTGEILYVYTGIQSEPAARAVLWKWFVENYDAILARLSPSGMLRTPGILGEACDPLALAQLEAFFRPKTALLPGTPRTLALAEEQIDRCMALRAAKAGEIRAALLHDAM